MAKKNNDQDRRNARAWAQEWAIRRKNRTIITVIAVIVGITALGIILHYGGIMLSRSTFSSAEEMREAMQGRFAIESSYMDIIIEGDDLTLTYWSYSHYDRRYAEEYGYDAEQDSVYKDRIVKWDYKNGIIKTEWMDDMFVDRDGNIQRGTYTTFYRTDKPRPDPIDPSTLKNYEGDSSEDAPEIDEEAVEERQEDIESMNEAAAAAAAAGIGG